VAAFVNEGSGAALTTPPRPSMLCPMEANESVDPKRIPQDIAERRALADELQGKAREAFARGELQTATLYACDLLMLFPNERAYLETFDEIVQSSDDPLATIPVQSGAVHPATAAGRARVLMMSRRLPEALDLLGKVFEITPHVPYVHWMRRWLQPPVIASLSWEILFESVVRPALSVAVRVGVPPDDGDLRVINLRAAADIFAALRDAFADESILWYGESLIRRRLGDPEHTVQVAAEGVERWPDDGRMRTGLLNAYRDAGRPDDAVEQAREALRLNPGEHAPLHDAAWALIEQERWGAAAQLFAEIVEHDPTYPGAIACLRYTRFKANGGDADRQALIALRDRDPWDESLRELVDDVDPPVPYVNVLPAPMDPTLRAARHLAAELEHVIRCCGVGGHLGLTLGSHFLDSPSVEVAFDLAMRRLGANGSLTVQVDAIQEPDPRVDKAQVSTPIWRAEGSTLTKALPEGDPEAQEAIASIARQHFRRDIWDPAAQAVAARFGPKGYSALLSVLLDPPLPDEDDPYDPFAWTWRCQVATAVTLSHLGPWQTGSARAALYSMVYGPSDWITGAAIVAFTWRADERPEIRAEIVPIFKWLRSVVPAEGFTAWEIVLAEAWRSMGSHDETTLADLTQWIEELYATLPTKNAVRPAERRYADMSLEEFARASLEGRSVPEWEQAVEASAELQEQLAEAKRTLELEAMGVSREEKAALDQIHRGEMDMHQRVAQQQQAEREVDLSVDDPDPLIFEGQPVARLSDYVAILKGMQAGDMNGALAQYGLDMGSYAQVATAWGAKLAANPVLTAKFHRLMKA